ncbi:putative flavin-binding monooxygenase-like family protein [Phaeoacremonium minimum UCRPA7]|uniref:Putative flavin-binding monooxygenase-like family protein n=1 Tax=Phaeoacremonium minimum (strain UCR-PA7) TaxID=1286976 RepID=R8BGE0_PHAM7|nr:putative flavin-binding monooxygenase-like family protein [Phaeoacremonium minimum UCRPA7]EON98383.1 putative flavin-binding monooxygenase-like family protein [Phaeoacremonium minimum UCRPA7]
MGSVPVINGIRGSSDQTKPAQSLAEIEERYKNEHDKRIRSDGLAQFTDLYSLPKFRRFKQDPWADPSTYDSLPRAQDGDRREILIMGTGIAALVFAVRLLDAGFKAEDMQFVDTSAGFGGTWYWNRYPGLMCDVESYIYMPLLEETGYIPKNKYASGTELREQSERIAKQYGLSDHTWFRTRMLDSVWDDDAKEWVSRLSEQLSDGQEREPVTVRSRFVILTTGLMLIPQIPQIKGVEKFDGECFHAARWDYNVTGGTPQDPSLVNLRGKKVGIIGTGASAVQVVPELAKWVDQLYVFQRTPSAVDTRGNRPTDVERFKTEIGNKPGWWAARCQNFAAFVNNSDPKPEVDLVHDGWTTMLSYSALIGTTAHKPKTPEEIQEYYKYLHELDLERQSKIRDRVDVIVKDPTVAAKLKPWYAGFCKRPCFHDEYLQSFNKPNVQLVDTDGRGIDEITETGLVVKGTSYNVDVLILATGYKSPFLFSPPGRVGVDVIGRDGVDLDKKWTNAVTTLHGLMSHDFPNLFWPGFIQAGGNPNYTYTINQGALQVAHIMAAGVKKSISTTPSNSTYRHNFTVEATAEGEENWSQAVASHAFMLGATAGCTPSYMNAEGELEGLTDPVQLAKTARSATWGKGQADFDKVLVEWRKKGNFEGVDIKSVSD